MARFSDIPQLPHAAYEVDVGWEYLEEHIARWSKGHSLDLNPDFQRGHIWTRAQQIAYVEYQLQGGEVGQNLVFSCPDWNNPWSTSASLVLVDGKQRLEAVRAFWRGGFKVFGSLRNEYTDYPRMFIRFKWRVVEVKTRADLLRLYLQINAGGTPHTQEELDRVRRILADEVDAESRLAQMPNCTTGEPETPPKRRSR